jgi:cytochrome c553
MARQETLVAKKRGPKPTGIGFPIQVRLQPDQLAALDAWIARHPDPKPSRPEAVRQILTGALGGDRPSTTIPSKVTGRDIV